MSEPEPRWAAEAPGRPNLSDLGSLAARLQDALGGDGGEAGRRRELLDGWRAWLGGAGADSALLRSVLDAVAGWGGGGLSRAQFEAAVNRVWAAQLDRIARERGPGAGGVRGGAAGVDR